MAFYHLWIEQRETQDTGEPLAYEPLVSVVVPVYNVAGELLISCIESVKAQAYQNWELVLVDDASGCLWLRGMEYTQLLVHTSVRVHAD